MTVTAGMFFEGAIVLIASALGVALPPTPVNASAPSGEVATIAADVGSGRLKCAAVIADHLGRIAARDGALHAIVAVNPGALAEAAAIDRLPVSRRRGWPLLCAPLLVKDNIDVAGLATTAGSVALAGNVARRDANSVARLKRAGAVVLAKTNLSEFAFNYRGRSSIRGQTNSPFSPAESAGGSSSGNAAALAAGIGVLGLGTDTSGSLRVPAALTGIVGLRTTFGRLSTAGVVPLGPGQDVVGPMCREARDCVAVLRVLDRRGTRRSIAQAGIGGLRIGVLAELMSPDPGTVTVVARALAALRTAGAHVTNLTLRDQSVLIGKDSPPGTTATFASRSAFAFPVVIDRYLRGRRGVPHSIWQLRDALATLAAAGRTDPVVLKDVDTFIANRASAATDPRFAANGRFRNRFVGKRIGEVFACTASSDCIDILVYPSVQQPSALAGKGPDTAGTHRLAAYSGYPAVAVPIGMVDTTNGPRPASLELMGRPGSDQGLLAIAEQWQALLAPGPSAAASNTDDPSPPAPPR